MDSMSAGAGRNAGGLQAVHHGVPRHRRTSGIDAADEGLPGMPAVRGLLRQAEPVEIGEVLAIPGGPARALGDEALELLDLDEAERTLQVGHAVV